MDAMAMPIRFDTSARRNTVSNSCGWSGHGHGRLTAVGDGDAGIAASPSGALVDPPAVSIIRFSLRRSGRFGRDRRDAERVGEVRVIDLMAGEAEPRVRVDRRPRPAD